MNYEIKSVLSVNLGFNVKSFLIHEYRHNSAQARPESIEINTSLTQVNTDTSQQEPNTSPTQVNNFGDKMFNFGDKIRRFFPRSTISCKWV